MRLIGPNVLGIIDTVCKLNASFAAGMPDRGHIAFMSQSGALCTSILDLALGQGIGFSRFYSIGNKADINEIDLVKAWAEDPETRAIMAYLEGITDGPEFIRVAREVTRHKPIIAIKSGTTSAGSQGGLIAYRHAGRLRGGLRRRLQAVRHHPRRLGARPVRLCPGLRPPAACSRATPSRSSPTRAAPASWPPTPSSAPACSWPR